MKERNQLDIDRKIIAYVAANPGTTISGIAQSLIRWYSPPYVRDRVWYLEATGRVSVDRKRGRRATSVRLREEPLAAEA